MMEWLLGQPGGPFLGAPIASTSAGHPLWVDHAPRIRYLYPWKTLRVPHAENATVARQLVEDIKAAGNESFKNEDFYDALWKYEHALQLCRVHSALEGEMATLHCNCSMACLKLGDAGSIDLLDADSIPQMETMWYSFSQQHSCRCLDFKPSVKIAHKAFYRRAEGLRRVITVPRMKAGMDHVASKYGMRDKTDAETQCVMDYVDCWRLGDTPEPKLLCEAIIILIDYNVAQKVMPKLSEDHVKSGFTTSLLKELLDHPNCKSTHLQYALMKLRITSPKPFNTSFLSASKLLKLGLRDNASFEKLCDCGMLIEGEDIKYAIRILPNSRADLFKILLAHCTTLSKVFQSACDMAKKVNKKQLLAVLQQDAMTLFKKLKKEGNLCFGRGEYEEALGKYFQALNLSRKHDMVEEMAVIRGNCAQACLKLQLYSDALTHCNECIQLDPKIDKAYFRRAEALRALLQSSNGSGGGGGGGRKPGKFSDVVADYCHCHKLKQNLESFCLAIILAVNHKCMQLLPTLQPGDVQSGFSTKLLRELVPRSEVRQAHLLFVIFHLPPLSLATRAYNASQISLGLLLEKPVDDDSLLKRLFDLGMRVKEEDVMKAVNLLPESKLKTLQLILGHATVIEVSRRCISDASEKAMEAKKMNFLAHFLEVGAMPNPVDLAKLVGLPSKHPNPVFQHYLTYTAIAAAESCGEPMPDGVTGIPGNALPPSTPPVAKQRDENAVEQVHVMNSQAKAFFKKKNYQAALATYHQAVEYCGIYELSEEMAAIYGNCAHIYLKIDKIPEAFKYSILSIERCKGYAKGYLRRAQSLQKALQSHSFDVAQGLDMSHVITDYLVYHQLEPKAKFLCEAIVLAVDNDHTEVVIRFLAMTVGSMSDVYVEYSSEEVSEAMVELIARGDTKQQHLEFFLLEVFLEPFDASKVKLEKVLVEKQVTSMRIMEKLIHLGMPLTEEGIKFSIQRCSAKSTEILKLLVSKCAKIDLNELCKTAASARKHTLALWLVDKGAKLPTQTNELMIQLIKQEDFDGVASLLGRFPKSAVEKVDLGELMDTNLARSQSMVEKFISAGVSPNGCGQKKPLAVILASEFLSIEKKMDLICLLLMKGADCNALTVASKIPTTPLHVATDLALRCDGDTRVISAVLESPSFNTAKVSNKNGESPIHLAVKSHIKKEISIKVLTVLLNTSFIDPTKRDHYGKRALDHLPRKDTRIKLLEDCHSAFKPAAPEQKKQKKKKRGKKSATVTSAEAMQKDPPITAAPEVGVAGTPTGKGSLETAKRAPTDKPKEAVAPSKAEVKKSPLEKQLMRVFEKDASYFQDASEGAQNVGSDDEERPARDASPSKSVQKRRQDHLKKSDVACDSDASTATTDTVQTTEGTDDDLTDPKTDFEKLSAEFDNLPWEVEVTKNVIKFMKKTKIYSQTDRKAAVRTIQKLAEGRRTEKLAKQVGDDKRLYEARMTKGGRILWEKAVQFSSKLTGDPSCPVYTEVIRVWEILPQHDDLDKKIAECTRHIKVSHERGNEATVRLGLQPQSCDMSAVALRGQEANEIPRRFILSQSKQVVSEHQFVPAASTKENEYNITTFYSFDTMAVKSLLINENTRRDYPFKEWQKEHEIIKLPLGEEAILLLGRSGTGKTTCCLYRLWNEFRNFWDPECSTYRLQLPRKRLISSDVFLQPQAKKSEDDPYGSEDLSQDDDDADPFYDCPSEGRAELGACGSVSHQACAYGASFSYNQPGLDESMDSDVPASETVDEDLHQVFVTKNYVLCDQMKKRFYNMAAAYDFLDEHLPFEAIEIPNNLSDFNNMAFPIFITARKFYELLDNSLGGDKTFFSRDTEGNIQVKVSSLDYDHEDNDTLLDLEQSEDESDEMPMTVTAETGHQVMTAKQHSSKWIEVTALYFKDYIWPCISHRAGANLRDFDPLLVWMEIQSFIKGSDLSLRKARPLNLVEYKEIGNKMAPNYSDHRDNIYELFKMYVKYCQKQRMKNYIFDECDLIHDIYRRLQQVHDVPWSIHSLYIDEVQDFTQAELAVFIHCCRDPNSMFFTGDTAQSIMRGISFRFEDLRSSFFRIHEKFPLVKVPSKPHSLPLNFRSHSGILKLAGTIIDLISEFFKSSIDHLPEDEGMFLGPTPVLLESCEEGDLALLLSANRREASAIEFGAHQVILVQSKAAKDALPEILKGAIVLTIFEAKGLEFDDVLLYNFFSDSLVDDKGWRVVTSYLERHPSLLVTSTKLPGSTEEPRSLLFDEKAHKSLNAELKYLYTAITRAKCNLWVYDSDKQRRLPMFDYWHKRDSVKVVELSASEEGKYNLVFASNSTAQQWRAQGDYFCKKRLWEQARKCYDRSGPDCVHLAMEANARSLIQKALQLNKPQHFSDAALCFLEGDRLHHSLFYLKAAATCLRSMKPPKYRQAAMLFERLGERSKACQAYLKAKDLESFIRLEEQDGHYSTVVKTLAGKSVLKKKEALVKAAEYEKRGISLTPELTASELSYTCAKFYSERKEKQSLLEVLKYMPEVSKRVRFLKEAKCFDEAYKVYIQRKMYKEAFRLASAQGWHEQAIELAREQKNPKIEARFVLQKAKADYLKICRYDSKQALASSAKAKEYLRKLLKSANREVKAEANLLLGILTKDAGNCTSAWHTYNLLKHKAGEIEAFRVFAELKKSEKTIIDVSAVINVCLVAQETAKVLMVANDINQTVQQAVEFYGLQKVGGVYLTPDGQNIWISKITEFTCKDKERTDLDGMLRLEASDTRDEISKHCGDLPMIWLKQFDVERKVKLSLSSFSIHREFIKSIKDNRYLPRQYSAVDVSVESLKIYLQNCVHIVKLGLLMNTFDCLPLVLGIFSPQVALHIPISRVHVETMRKATRIQPIFHEWIKANVVSRETPDKVRIDSWMIGWRVCCITTPDMKILFSAVEQKAKPVNEEHALKKKDFLCPPAFLYWRNEDKYFHVFYFWLRSCQVIKEDGLALWAAKLTVNHFLGNIAESRTVVLSVMNAVDIISLHTTALLAMIAQYNAMINLATAFEVPLLYRHVVEVFDAMNTKEGQTQLLAACGRDGGRASRRLFSDCVALLSKCVDLLIGTYKKAPWFCILRFALSQHSSVNSGAALHCLILTFVLYGNLVKLTPKTYDYHKKITSILKRALKQDNPIVPDYVAEAYKLSTSPNFNAPPGQAFQLVSYLLSKANIDPTLARLLFKPNKNRVEFIPLSPQQISLPPHLLRSPPAAIGRGVPFSSVPVSAQTSAILQRGSTVLSPAAKPFRPAGSLPTASSQALEMQRSDPAVVQVYDTQESALAQPCDSQQTDSTPGVVAKGDNAQLYNLASDPQSDTVKGSLPQQHTSTLNPHQQQPDLGTDVDAPFDPPTSQYPTGQGFDNLGTDVDAPYTATAGKSEYSAENSENIDRQSAPQNEAKALPSETLLQQGSDVALLQSESPELTEDLETFEQTDLGETLTARVVHEPQIDPEMIDPEIVSKYFCNACDVTFKTEENPLPENFIESSGEKQVDFVDEKAEVYLTHVTSEAHRATMTACRRFMDMINIDSDSARYISLLQLLEELRVKCESAANADDSGSGLARLIDDIKILIEENELGLCEFKSSRTWREGIQYITKVSDRMDRLLHHATKTYKDIAIVETPPTALEEDEQYGVGEVAKLTEQDMVVEQFDSPPVSKKKMRTVQEKDRSRQRKKDKRKKT